ncbi:MAG: ABC transporter ATPase [Flavobacteriaceae bacterium]|nr:ABC transporter ATPase [Flavobacteriaceae bacterium]
MLVDFNTLPETSKIYIYPSNRKFYPNEFPIIEEKIKTLLHEFEASNLFFEIKYNRFILIFISDETPLSMEQNDLLISFIFSLEKEFDISLMDKVNVCFKQGKYVQLKEILDFKKLIKNKGVSKNTIVFNNLIHTKEEFECCWETPAINSWISHFF